MTKKADDKPTPEQIKAEADRIKLEHDPDHGEPGQNTHPDVAELGRRQKKL